MRPAPLVCLAPNYWPTFQALRLLSLLASCVLLDKLLNFFNFRNACILPHLCGSRCSVSPRSSEVEVAATVYCRLCRGLVRLLQPSFRRCFHLGQICSCRHGGAVFVQCRVALIFHVHEFCRDTTCDQATTLGSLVAWIALWKFSAAPSRFLFATATCARMKSAPPSSPIFLSSACCASSWAPLGSPLQPFLGGDQHAPVFQPARVAPIPAPSARELHLAGCLFLCFTSMAPRMSPYRPQSRRIFFKCQERSVEVLRKNVSLLHRVIDGLQTHRFAICLDPVVRIQWRLTRHSVTSSRISVLKFSSSGARFTDCNKGSIRLTALKCFSAIGSSR